MWVEYTLFPVLAGWKAPLPFSAHWQLPIPLPKPFGFEDDDGSKAEISIKAHPNNAYSHSLRGGTRNEPFIQFTFYLKWKFPLSGKAIK